MLDDQHLVGYQHALVVKSSLDLDENADNEQGDRR